MSGGAARAGNPPGPSVGTPSADHAAFYKQWGPAAARAGAALGDDPNVVLAHWAQETSFGRNVHDFNIGNMQAGSTWQGRTVVRGDTHKDGSAYQTRFRAYDSPEQFADDYVDRIKKRWPGAMNVGDDALAFGRGMRPGQQGGYMENPNAAEDIASTAARVRGEIGRMQQSPTMQPPSAQGEPLALASPDRREDNSDPQRLHVHITGDRGFRANVLEASAAVKVEGPLVQRPGLLGAQA